MHLLLVPKEEYEEDIDFQDKEENDDRETPRNFYRLIQ